MGWGKVAQYLIEFVKWVWQNKFIILFFITTLSFAIAYGCEKRDNEKKDKIISDLKVNYSICQSNYNQSIDANKNFKIELDKCYESLNIVNDKSKYDKVIIEQYEFELSKFKKLSEDIDKETDPEKQLEIKKRIIEELFKGKNAIQIRSILKHM